LVVQRHHDVGVVEVGHARILPAPAAIACQAPPPAPHAPPQRRHHPLRPHRPRHAPPAPRTTRSARTEALLLHGGAIFLPQCPRSASDGVQGKGRDRKSTRLNSSHVSISYAVFCLKKKTDSSYSTLQ